MRHIQTYNFKGKKALVRVDFNVPLDANCQVIDGVKISRTIPTIRKVLDDGGAVILVTHLGRPKQGYEACFSLQHLVSHLANNLATSVIFAHDCIGPDAQGKAKQLRPGEVLLLENVRFHPAEEQGDREFAQALAALGDVYINDAFGTAHRAHASTTVVAQCFQDKLAGYLLQEEISNVNRVLAGAQKPFTAIIGGAKVLDKIQALECLLDRADRLLIGGGVANTFQQALGGQLGSSLVEESQLGTALHLLEQAKHRHTNIVLPTDVVIANQLDDQAHTTIVASNAIQDGWMALDIGPQSQVAFEQFIQDSKTILWSGPIGVFEIPSFSYGTRYVAAAVAHATRQGAFSLIGGGDSAAAIKSLGYSNQVSYISTGGGALLAYLADQTLPGIRALS
ncbi:MAG: phosphoglycerate kinase [Bacteroidota bacterium]